MAKVLGKSTVVSLNGTDISAYCNSSDIDRINNLLSSETYGDSAKEYTPGLTDGTLNIAGLYDGTPASLDGVLDTAFTTAAGVTVIWSPNGTTSTNAKYTGTIMVKDYKVDSKVDQLETWSAMLQFSGGITRTTW